MMNTTTAQAIERIKRQVSFLKRLADETSDYEAARAIYVATDIIAEQLDSIELDAAPACEELPAGIYEPLAA